MDIIARFLGNEISKGFGQSIFPSFYPFQICVRKDSRFRILDELIEEACRNFAVLKYASAGSVDSPIELMADSEGVATPSKNRRQHDQTAAFGGKLMESAEPGRAAWHAANTRSGFSGKVKSGTSNPVA